MKKKLKKNKLGEINYLLSNIVFEIKIEFIFILIFEFM